jgi:hypothetical protein
MKRTTALIFGLAALLFVFLACGPFSKPEPTETPVVPTATEEIVPTPAASKATVPPPPVEKPTAVPKPLKFSGYGDGVVDVTKWDAPALFHFKHTSGTNFVIQRTLKGQNKPALFINGSGKFEGYYLIDALQGELTTKFTLKVDGNWVLEIFPLVEQYIHTLDVPGKYSSTGPDVVYLVGESPSSVKFTCNYPGNFEAKAYAGNKVFGLAAEKGPLAVEKTVPEGTFIIAIDLVRSPWSMEVMSK